MDNQQRYYAAMESRALTAPVPLATSTYSPVSNAEIINRIEANMVKNNLTVERKRMYSNTFGTRVTGFFDVTDGSEFGQEHGLHMMFGYRNSYDKSMSVAFVAGATVWICENGCISGDMMAFKRKHTGTVAQELEDKIQIGVDRMKNEFGKLLLEVDVMKNYSMTPRQKAEILGVMYFERSIVTPTQLSIVKKQITQSEHFKEDNAWSLYNNVTESLKKSHAIDVIQDHIKFHGFMREIVGISPDILEAESQAEVNGSTP